MFSSRKFFRNSSTQSARFRVSDGFDSNFFILLEDPAKIQEARRQISERAGLHITGIIVKQTACWNPDWSYHFDPATIDFFENSMEVCDAAFWYVEENLEDAGGAFLPGLRFCPWGSSIVEEVSLDC